MRTLTTPMLALAMACSGIDGPKGTVSAADLCELTTMSWKDTFSNPCDSADGPVCYDELTILVEPTAVSIDDSSLDLAFCLEGEITAPGYGVTTTLADAASSGLLTLALGHGHLTADDGFAPCYGLTVGLDGSLDEVITFSEGSYWWKDGTKRKAIGESDDTGSTDEDDDARKANGTILTEGDAMTLDLLEGLATALGLPTGPVLKATSTDHWADPTCRPTEE